MDVQTEHGHRRGPMGLWAAWLVLGLVVLALAVLLPPSGDDWRRIDVSDHTLPGYLDRSRRFYLEHNGRVLPNVLSYLLMEPWWLRALVKAVTVVGLVAALQRVTGSSTVWGVLPAVLGVLLVPGSVFRQALAWSTGFFYYVPPMIGLVLLVGTLSGRWPGQRRAGRWWVVPGTALLGAATCLFMEPVTLAATGLAVGGVAVALLRRRPPSLALSGWALGTLGGALVMVGSPGLRSSLGGRGGYYGTGAESLVVTAVTNYSLLTRFFVLSSVTVLGLVLLACLAHGGRAVRRGHVLPGGLLVAGAPVVGAYAVPRRLLLTDRLTCAGADLGSCDLPVLALDLTMLVLLLVLVVATGLLATSPRRDDAGPAAPVEGSDRAAWVALLAATLLMLAPLLEVQPVGPRNLYGPLVTLTGMAMITLRPWVDGAVQGAGAGGGLASAPLSSAMMPIPRRIRGTGDSPRGVVVVRAGLASVVVAGLVLVGVVSWGNSRVFDERVAILEEAVAQRRSEVELPPYPHPGWVHRPDDTTIGYHYYVRERYDIHLTFAEPGS